MTLTPSRTLPFKCCTLFDTFSHREYIIHGSMSYFTDKPNFIFLQCCNKPVTRRQTPSEEASSNQILFDNKKNFTNTKTAEQEDYISTATDMKSVADCSAFVLLVNKRKIMVISNGMKFTSFLSKDYSSQTNDHIVNLIESNKIHDYDVFLRSLLRKVIKLKSFTYARYVVIDVLFINQII